ncbi:MAG: carbohydrate ABC transporter permease [Clostridia bacterium]
MKKKRSLEKKHNHIIEHVILIFVALLQAFPLLVMLINSFRTDKAIKNLPIALPESLYMQNYPDAWNVGGYQTAYLNSIFIGAVVVLGVLILGGLAAYAMAKLPLPGKGLFLGYFTMAMAIPGFLFLVPDYFMLSKLGLTDSQLGISLIYIALFMPLNIMLIRTYLIGLPPELEEAAKVDGCTELSTCWYITLPLARPIMTTVALLVFANCWNEFLWANTFLTSDQTRTVATRFYNFVSEYGQNTARVFTAGVISLAPIAVLYLTLQDNFIEGITAGGVKG